MHRLILSLAPLGSLAAALPAMSAEARWEESERPGGSQVDGEPRSFAATDGDVVRPDDGGYLLI